mmetsp:Transcript_45850/g.111106  ORF Transcript_45850/g.111106 Transcript_45850/m.111106 type:complete len:87 (-) Transcript_45850:280-540(-)
MVITPTIFIVQKNRASLLLSPLKKSYPTSVKVQNKKTLNQMIDSFEERKKAAPRGDRKDHSKTPPDASRPPMTRCTMYGNIKIMTS